MSLVDDDNNNENVDGSGTYVVAVFVEMDPVMVLFIGDCGTNAETFLLDSSEAPMAANNKR